MTAALSEIFTAMTGPFSRGRSSRRSGNPDNGQDDGHEKSIEDVNKYLMSVITSGGLSVTSQFNVFRNFFDIKTEHWNQFRVHLKTVVTENSSWQQVLDDEGHRENCAQIFLNKYGPEYWGNEDNRRRYLVPESIDKNEVCFYPESRRPLIAGVSILLEKTAKISCNDNGRDSARDSSTARPAGSGVSATRARTATSETNRSRSTVSAKKVKTASTKSPHSSATVTRQESKTIVDSNSDSRNRQVTAGPNGTHNTNQLSANQRATYFLVKNNISSLLNPVCVPFHPFESSTDFINKLVAKSMPRDLCLIDFEERFLDMQRYAIVTLPWSSTRTPFMIRPDTDDLDALMARLGSAWTAQEQGKLDAFEFGVEVTLIFEVETFRA